MSRSIHTTRRTLEKIRQKKHLSNENRSIALKEASDSLNQKRRTKSMVRKERRQQGPLPPSSVVSIVPIEVLDEGEFVHHGASADDIRAILEALPESARLGIHRIQLSLGKRSMDERADLGPRDPHTGRLCYELFSGVFSGPILGTFWTDSGLVSLYAYVYDRRKIPMSVELCELYLRLRALKTFVHEIAHHHDHIHRRARGRWRADRPQALELYAEKMEHEWTRTIVLPYLQRRYPRDVAELIDWVEYHGGLRVDLDFFAGDSRKTERGYILLLTDTSAAFECWLDEITTCRSLDESRLAFAWQLHYGDLYDKCLEILNPILSVSPDWIPALTCKGDTLVHLQDYDGALSIARRVFQMEPANPDAWEISGDVFQCRRDWNGLLKNCSAWERAGELLPRAMREMLLHRAIAYCALNNVREMETTVSACLGLFPFKTEEIAARRKKDTMARVFRRAGKPVPAEYLRGKK
jgi:tetratricopeptide (TPR) repeat protein